MVVFWVILGAVAVVFFIVFIFPLFAKDQSTDEMVSRSTAQEKASRLNACWFYQHTNGEKIGPILREELELMLSSEEIDHGTLVWASFLSDWVPANEVDEITIGVKEQLPEIQPGISKNIDTQTFQNILKAFSEQVDVPVDEIISRMRSGDHTGVSCLKVIARKLGVSPEQLQSWLGIKSN